jgi:phage shock protein A
MSVLTRLTATFAAGFDRLVGEIENHDAVVEAALRDNRRAYARARVRLGRMQQEVSQWRHRIEQLRADAEAWRRRALATTDETQAIECLRRAKRAEHEAAGQGEPLAEHERLAGRLEQEIAGVRRRIEALQQRRSQLRSREATADAAGRIRALEGNACPDLEETFERWEVRVTEAEVEATLDPTAALGATPATDPFATEMMAADEQRALQAELAALRRRARQQPENDHEA